MTAMNKVLFGALMCALLWIGGSSLTGCYLITPPIAFGNSAFTLPAPPVAAPTVPAPPVAAQGMQLPPLSSATPRLSVQGALTRTPKAQPIAAATPTPVPTLEPAESVVFYEADVTLLTYPLVRYQSDVLDPTYNWPYKRFDIERFRQEAPTPAPHNYRLLVLENAYLKVMILPELGGRIWQVIHKPSHKPMFYQNDVVKPTHWGIEYQKGWLALGGLEWSLPVSEHGYDWGTPWDYTVLADDPGLAAVTVSTPQDGRWLNASITITLRAGAASFEIEPTLTNLAPQPLAFSFWHNAMLAPGSGKRPTAKLHFVLPGESMTLHSTNDATLPPSGQRFPWPTYGRRDLSQLGNFRQYLGFFEAPAAHGPFVGLYDPAYDAGVVRIFPAETMRGSKVFSLGWQNALESSNFTDDDSMYVELHGGLASTFDDQYQLPVKGAVRWRETWYPVAGIGDLTFANELAAISVQPHDRQLTIGLYVTRPLAGVLVSFVGEVAQERIYLEARPDAPYRGLLARDTTFEKITKLELQDRAGRVLLTYQLP